MYGPAPVIFRRGLFLLYLYKMKSRVLKGILSKWLFTVMVVLSFFTFSGFVSPSTVKITAPNTTLIVKNTGKPVKSVYYRLSIKVNAHEGRFNLSSSNQLIRLSYSHTQKAQLAAKQTSKLVLNNKKCLFYHTIIYSQSLADDSHLI